MAEEAPVWSRLMFCMKLALSLAQYVAKHACPSGPKTHTSNLGATHEAAKRLGFWGQELIVRVLGLLVVGSMQTLI